MTNTSLVDRELSWLEFNRRVLEEAQDSSVPLLSRRRWRRIGTRPWRLRMSHAVERPGRRHRGWRRCNSARSFLPPQNGCRRRASRIAVTIASAVSFGERHGRRERSSGPAAPWRR